MPGSTAQNRQHDFLNRHPNVAADVLYIINAYEKCDQLEATPAQLDIEEAYKHVFGDGVSAPCVHCYPAFMREKRLLDSLRPR